MRLILSLALTSVLLLAGAMASFARAAAAPVPPATGIQEVVVMPAKDVKVVSTYPNDGASIPGGTMILKIVFDQQMTPEAWSYGPLDKAQFPNCLARPRLLNDKKTFVLLCSLGFDTPYGLQVNAAPDFVSTVGRAAPSFRLNFTTSSALPTTSMQDALKAAGLTEADDPIMSEAVVAGAVQASPHRADEGTP